LQPHGGAYARRGATRQTATACSAAATFAAEFALDGELSQLSSLMLLAYYPVNS